MQIVIDIDEDTYNSVISDSTTYVLDEILVENAIYNGIVLPKGHGRLIDADKFDVYFLENKSEEFVNGAGRVLAQIDNAPTVLEADKEN